MKRINNTSKILLATTLSLTMGLTGCNSNSNEKNGTTEVKTERDFTPLEKEISELEDFQIIEKTYDNKDLEPFNKMQGYLYSIKEVNGKDSIENISLIPPTEKGKEYLEKDGDYYEIIDNVIIPCYIYYTSDGEWVKRYPTRMGETQLGRYVAAPEEYLYTSQDELNQMFGSQKEEFGNQFQLTK